MHHAPRDAEPLPRCEFDCPTFFLEVDQETPFHHVEELVFLVVVVPVELALHDAEPHHAIVYAAERLVVPSVFDRPGELPDVNELQETERLVQVD